MAKSNLVGEVQKLAIPDLRFQQTFQNAVKKEARRTNERPETQSDKQGHLTASVICKVVLRDVIIMPLVQGMLWTGILIAMKPWLRFMVRQGQLCGHQLYSLILGKNLIPKRN
ncbi:LADA_0H07998g1_1 [Lachancea dasiensis]|uniref:LADA_0H07998g1_1 n=1 Tax=Lachancea dasiensis TaxID=1072105 RepID=A0A1G4K2B7_9SACH|nr:LADA_0H07998g1_1 [Lachancea dasiensis]